MKNRLVLIIILSFHLCAFAQTDSIQTINESAPAMEIVDDEIYSMAENMPVYPGGNQAMQDFIARNFVYPPSCLENSIQGKVYVDFVVEKDGSTSGHNVVKPIPGGQAISTEALRVCKLLEGFAPGMDNGHLVRVRLAVPINCELSNQRKKKK